MAEQVARAQNFRTVRLMPSVGETDVVTRDEPLLVLAEGPSLLPELVAPLLPYPAWAVWLLPTPAFTARSLADRAAPQATPDGADRDRARRLRLDRLTG